MRAVVQRVSEASVTVGDRPVSEIGRGMLVLLGVGAADEERDAEYLARKCVGLRIFEDEEHKMNRSLRDIDGAVLAVSQFTLYADVSKGRRPSFVNAAPPELAKPLFDAFVRALRTEGVDVQTGEFGAKMAVRLENDGPVTLTLEVAAQAATG